MLLVNNFDVENIGKAGDAVNNAIRRMMLCHQRIANNDGIVMFKGETAELPFCIDSPNPNALVKYLWAGVAFGVYNPKNIITGDKVREGIIVMALRENGFRNNGISSARKALTMKYGQDYYSKPEAHYDIGRAAEHAVLYDKFLETANGWFAKDFKPIIPICLNVHLTGGAFGSKLAEDILFPRGLSANLNNLWEPSEIMRLCAKWRGMSDEECYETWNGGQGVISVIDAKYEKKFVRLARCFGIDARCAGSVIKKAKPTVVIKSKFNGEIIKWSA